MNNGDFPLCRSMKDRQKIVRQVREYLSDLSQQLLLGQWNIMKNTNVHLARNIRQWLGIP